MLAKRDSEEAEELFNEFGITVANNIPDERKIITNFMNFENNECYKKDVVYGTTFEYQADILRDEYELLDIRKKRNFDIIIVDEIDSMLIDEYASKTRLAKSKPFLEKYSVFLQLLWSFYKAAGLNDYEIEDKEICDKLVEYLTNKIKDVINLKTPFKFGLSEQNKKFALDQVDNWVQSLIKSLRMKLNNEYLIIENDIVPVDQDNTGVIQKSVMLSFGLHQFLQMKHNLPVTPISITTNYLSNLGFFKRYNRNGKNNILGMTGTLGSQKERNLLGNIYKLDFDYIPPNSPRILKELTSKICFNEKSWYKNIVRIVKRETNANRGILIICDTIESVDNIYNELNIHCQNIELIRIIGEDNEDKLFPDQLGLNQVIISTNISGRGTDIKLSPEILENGGLHVMITFIPNNSRVEEQNYGRAGRKGEPGTWQLVINFQREIRKFYSNYEIKDKYNSYVKLVQEINAFNNKEIENALNHFSIENLKDLREKRESFRIDNAMKYIDKVDKEDKLFNLYCEMIDSREELREEKNKIYLDSIEERWAIFLYNLNLLNKSWTQVEIEFNNFKNTIFRELNNKEVIKNPGYYNNYVNHQLALSIDYERELSKIDEIKEAFKNCKDKIKKFFSINKNPPEYEKYIEISDLSIRLDDNSFIPYYLRGISKILNGQEGLNDFKISLEKINKEMHSFQLLIRRLQFFNINKDFALFQYNLLYNIKEQIIEVNIKDYGTLNASDLKITKRKYDDLFSYDGNENKENTRKNYQENKIKNNNDDRKIPKYLKKYFETLASNGLEYFFFLKEKASFWKIGAMVLGGVGFIALSLLTFGITLPAASAGLIAVGSLFGLTGLAIGGGLLGNALDLVNKGYEDNYFKDSYDLDFFDFLSKRKKVRRFKELDIEQICSKKDLEFQKKKNLEEENNFKKGLIKKLRLLDLTDERIEKINNQEEEINDSEEINKKKEQKKKALNKILTEKEKKSIIANNILKKVDNSKNKYIQRPK